MRHAEAERRTAPDGLGVRRNRAGTIRGGAALYPGVGERARYRMIVADRSAPTLTILIGAPTSVSRRFT